jgi:crotonobetainyl-CoA:carnitine CoA-transferase CaiB-like acyl-CoA transferase
MVMPLEGIKIIDLSRLAPGPFCTMILADLGADVIRVEEFGKPSGRRATQSKQDEINFQTLIPPPPYNALNRNKKSIGLDLKKKEARNVFYKLAEKSDVVVEEFRPGVTKRLGISYDILSKINPKLIYCSITGYGQTGPYSHLAGHDVNYIAMAGVLGSIGENDRKPVIPLNLLADYASGGMNGAIGILTALIARGKTGKGQYIDISLTDGVVSLLSSALSNYFVTGDKLEPGSSWLNGSFPHYNTYCCSDDKYISIGALEPWFYTNLCRAVGREDFIPYGWDKAKYPEIFEYFATLFRTKTRDEWIEILQKHDVCVAPVHTLDEVTKNPHFIERGMIVEFNNSDGKKIIQPGISIKLSDTPGGIRHLAPESYEDTEDVLRKLGYTFEKIKSLKENGIIA